MPEPLGPMMATISPAPTATDAPRSASDAPNRFVSRCAADQFITGACDSSLQLLEPGLGQIDPAQVGFEVEQGMVGEQPVDLAARLLHCGQLAHPLEVAGALGIEDRRRVAAAL